MYRDRDSIKSTLNQLFESLVAVANADDVITDDEQRILDRIRTGIENMEEQLMQVLESGLSADEYHDLVQQILQDIIHNTTKVAQEDGVITPDESALIQKLRDFAKRGISDGE